MAHLLSKPPDFDQILSVKDTDKQFTDYWLSQDLRLRDQRSPFLKIAFPLRNLPTARLKPNQEQDSVGTFFKPSGDVRTIPVAAKIKVGTEYYFEEGELRAPPEFATTPAERAAGFP